MLMLPAFSTSLKAGLNLLAALYGYYRAEIPHSTPWLLNNMLMIWFLA